VSLPMAKDGAQAGPAGAHLRVAGRSRACGAGGRGGRAGALRGAALAVVPQAQRPRLERKPGARARKRRRRHKVAAAAARGWRHRWASLLRLRPRSLAALLVSLRASHAGHGLPKLSVAACQQVACPA